MRLTPIYPLPERLVGSDLFSDFEKLCLSGSATRPLDLADLRRSDGEAEGAQEAAAAGQLTWTARLPVRSIQPRSNRREAAPRRGCRRVRTRSLQSRHAERRRGGGRAPPEIKPKCAASARPRPSPRTVADQRSAEPSRGVRGHSQAAGEMVVRARGRTAR